MSYQDVVLGDNPVAYWRLGEASGSTAADSAGTLDGTYSGSLPTSATGLVENTDNAANSFNGSTDYVDIGNPSALELTNFSFEAWFTTSQATPGQVLYRWANHGFGIEMMDSSYTFPNNIRFFFYDSDANLYVCESESPSYDDGEIHHIVATWDGTDMTLHIDNTLKDTVTPGATIHYSSGGTAIGRNGPYDQSYWSGTIDEVAIYDYALNTDQIAEHYDVGVTLMQSTDANAGAYPNQRNLDRTQTDDVLWAMFWNGESSTTNGLEFWYSTDDGSNWYFSGHESSIGFSGTGTTYTPNGSFFIDVDDYAHVTYKDRHDGFVYYRRGTPNGDHTEWTWSTATAINDQTTVLDYPDIIAHPEGTGWMAHIVCSYQSGTTNIVEYMPVTISSGGSVTMGSLANIGGSYGDTSHLFPSIDFHHTGDGKTVADGTPHLYTGWSGRTASIGTRFKKATYSGGSWSWGDETTIQSSMNIAAETFHWTNCLFDGTRVIIGGLLYDGSQKMVLYERDEADTTTTTRLDLASNDSEYIGSGSMTYDSANNVFFAGRNGPSGLHNSYRRWVRDTDTFESYTSIDSTITSTPLTTFKRGWVSGKLDLLYKDNTASPFDMTYSSIAINQAPNAPTLVAPEDNGTVSGSQSSVDFDWTFSDPDSGDTQSAYALRRKAVPNG